jgi:hypothetical protein
MSIIPLFNKKKEGGFLPAAERGTGMFWLRFQVSMIFLSMMAQSIGIVIRGKNWLNQAPERPSTTSS